MYDREAVLSRWANDEDSNEIAAALGMPAEAVRVIVCKARKKGDERAKRRVRFGAGGDIVWGHLTREEQDEMVEEARRIIAASDKPLAYYRIGQMLGLKKADGLRRRLDPAWATEKNRNQQIRRKATRTTYRHIFTREHGDAKPSPDCIAARLAEIPPDTRDLTAYLMGDPIPGRRALDRLAAAKGEGT